MWEYRRRVKYYETDKMGVVHHSNYLRLIEDARMEWLRENVMSYSEMERLGIIIPAVSASGKFLSFLHFDEPFKVSVRLVKFSGVKMDFEYQIHSTDTGVLCYEGKSSHYFADAKNSYRPYIAMRKKFPEIYEKISAQIN
jgi:acyl-CoA thioester hydrolase